MKTLEKWLKNISNHKRELIFSTVFGLVTSTIVWITVLNREVEYPVSYWIPFESYMKVFQGQWRWLVENMENIAMFIPLGLMFQMIVVDRKKVW